MSPTRREFLSRAALAAAMAGVGPGLASAMAAFSQSARPYLDLATRCAMWIDQSTQRNTNGTAWPADPLKPDSIGLDLYNGMPGVVSFFGNLYHASGDEKWRDRAQNGGSYLLAEGAKQGAALGGGLYTGLAGLATTYRTLETTKVGPIWADAARRTAKQLASMAKRGPDGAEWSDSNDIISGTAGIGLFLVEASTTWKDKELADLAVQAGRKVLKTAQPAEGGLMWFPSALLQRNYPNFSHGTAGVAYFLATLYQQTKDKAFLDGALAGAKYLDAVATKRDGARAIFHVSGGGEDRFYLSWCHGPVGTARLFHRLQQITGDRKWGQVVDELTAWLMTSGAPEQQSAGYWNNISQCCGGVGIGQYCIDLARHHPTPAADKLRERVTASTRSKATDDPAGLRWVQAENRAQPENLVAQTGFMQGAAGVGTFFLQLDAFSRGVKWPTPLPDSPWRG
ncbi:MAG: lanthionine synthetase LanC family protein [Vicinamibacterales bacterium]